MAVVIGRTAIHYNIWNAARGGDQRKGCGRLNREGRAQRDNKIGPRDRRARLFEHRRIEALTEADRGRLEKSAAITCRRAASFATIFEVRFRIAPPVAALAFDFRICPMEFDEALGTCSGLAVQAVNVLGDNATDFARVFEAHDRLVDHIRSRAQKTFAAFKFVIPMLDPGRFRTHEILIIDRLTSRPDAVGTAKIGDTAFGGNAGAGENDGLRGIAQVIRQVHGLIMSVKRPGRQRIMGASLSLPWMASQPLESLLEKSEKKCEMAVDRKPDLNNLCVPPVAGPDVVGCVLVHLGLQIDSILSRSLFGASAREGMKAGAELSFFMLRMCETAVL